MNQSWTLTASMVTLTWFVVAAPESSYILHLHPWVPILGAVCHCGVSFMEMSLNGCCEEHLPTRCWLSPWLLSLTPPARGHRVGSLDIFKPTRRWQRDLFVFVKCRKSVQGRARAATYQLLTVHRAEVQVSGARARQALWGAAEGQERKRGTFETNIWCVHLITTNICFFREINLCCMTF